jgi:hypothetical protein
MRISIDPIVGPAVDPALDRAVVPAQKKQPPKERRRREGRGRRRSPTQCDVVTLSGKAPETPGDPEDRYTG